MTPDIGFPELLRVRAAIIQNCRYFGRQIVELILRQRRLGLLRFAHVLLTTHYAYAISTPSRRSETFACSSLSRCQQLY
jgi:hypothetical protein